MGLPPNSWGPNMARRIHLIVLAGLLAAVAFPAFLKGPEARAIVEKYGYTLE